MGPLFYALDSERGPRKEDLFFAPRMQKEKRNVR